VALSVVGPFDQRSLLLREAIKKESFVMTVMKMFT